MSMQRVFNYGSFLQSYSLKKNLEKMGAEVCMVDYHIEKALVSDNSKKEDKKSKLLKKISDKYFYPRKISIEILNKYMEEEWWIKQNFVKEMLPLLGVKDERNYNPELDVLVIGSDEVFNCLQPNPAVGYSRELFGYDNKALKLISYAASFGNTMNEGLVKYGIYDEVRDMLSKFDGLSVRDDNSLSIVNKMNCRNVSKNVDPVFLYDYAEESRIDVPESNYIIVYAYSCRITKKEASAILSFARKHKKKIICIEGFHEYLENYVRLNPFEVLAYFRNADYIITDTFHGTVFSIKYNKQFVSIVRGGTETSYGNSAKLGDLLKTFDLEERELTKLNELEEKMLMPIDYNSVNAKITEEQEKAFSYLRKYVV